MTGAADHRVRAPRQNALFVLFALISLFSSSPAIQSGSGSRLATVSNVLYWSTKDSTRVVIDIDEEVKYEKARLSKPDRLYLDLPRTRLTAELQGKTYVVEDDVLQRIRLGQHKRDLVRIVFDSGDASEFNIFHLYNPYRIVVDVTSPRNKGTAETATLPEMKRQKVKELERPIALPENQVASASLEKITPELTRGLTRTLGLKIGKIVIDPGHGGADTGTISKKGLKEKDLVLDISKRLGKYLERRLGAEVLYTREDDTFIPLEERTAFANQHQADLFISIHANSSRDPHASGIETYFLSLVPSEDATETAARENASSQKNIHELEDLIKKIALREKIDESKEFASNVQKTFFNGLKKQMPKAKNRGVKHAPFIVLIGAHMPSILVEVGFLSNPRDEKIFRHASTKDKMAECLFHGIEAYTKALSTSNLALGKSN